MSSLPETYPPEMGEIALLQLSALRGVDCLPEYGRSVPLPPGTSMMPNHTLGIGLAIVEEESVKERI